MNGEGELRHAAGNIVSDAPLSHGGGHAIGLVVGNVIGWALYGLSHIPSDMSTWAALASFTLSCVLLTETNRVKAIFRALRRLFGWGD